MAWVLACDLGGSSFRAALVDETGTIGPRVVLPVGDIADPHSWWALLTEAVAALAGDLAFRRIAAIAISAFTRTQVCLGADGQVLRPAMTWRDTPEPPLLPENHPETAAVNAFHPLARLAFLARSEPATMAALAYVVDPKDYLNFRLTGRVAIDRIASARLIASAAPGPDGRSLLDVLGVAPSILADVLAPTDIVGRVRDGLPGAMGRLAGVRVMAMANDTWASVLGLGALRPGFAYNLSGTTEVLGLIHDTNAAAEGLLTVDWGPGCVQIGGPSQTGADSLVWLMRLIGREGEIGDALALLLSAPRHPQPLLFLPYLQGERVPYWDPSLRGAFLGLHRDHGPTDLAWAVLEGVAFLNRIVLERAEAACGRRAVEIRFGGGGAASAAWCQVKADVLDRPVVVAGDEPGLIGGAIVAFTALGRYADLGAGQARMVRTKAVFHPRPSQVSACDARFTLFRQAELAIGPISRALADIASKAPWGSISAS